MTSDELWAAVVEASDVAEREEAARTYTAYTLERRPTVVDLEWSECLRGSG